MYNTFIKKIVAELGMGRVGYGPSLYGPSWAWAELVMGRVCMGRVGYGPSLSWAEFVMGRDVQLPKGGTS